jgi:carboxylesterase
VTLVALLLILVGGWGIRLVRSARTERAILARLPLDSDGIIKGAAGITHRASTDRAVLILHGFGDTPQTVRYLADHLHGLGFSIRAPLLPGHGRTLAEFGTSTADAWLTAARRELGAVRQEFRFVGLIGVSMGGALSVVLAGEANAARTRSAGNTGDGGPDALVLLAPYLSMRPRAERLATMHRTVALFTKYVVSREEGSIRDPAERESNRGFGTLTPGALNQLRLLVQKARQMLPAVHQPVLMIQSTDDNRIDAAAAKRSFDGLGSTDKRLEWITDSGHVITVDRGRDRVLAMTGDWLLERVRVLEVAE